MPDIRCDLTSVLCNSHLYTIGGETDGDMTSQSTVYYAAFNGNGTLGVWNPAPALPSSREEHTSVVYNGYLYVIGGHDSTDAVYYSTVWYASCNTLAAVESVDGNYGKISLSCVPNPFTQKTVIRYSLNENRNDYTVNDLRLTIYDLTGRAVKSFQLFNSSTHQLANSVIWDGKDDNGNRMNGGIYFVKVSAQKIGESASGGEEIRKVIFLPNGRKE